jgi:hypothetical protein
MRPSWKESLAVLALTLGGLLGPGTARGADVSYEATWKVSVLLSNGREATPWLIKFDKGPKVGGQVLSTTGPFKGSALSDVSGDDKRLRFTLTAGTNEFQVVAYPPGGKEKPTKLLGSLHVRGQYEAVVMEKTDLEKLDDKTAVTATEGGKELTRALGLTDAEEREKALKDLIEKNAGKPVAYMAAQILIQVTVNRRPEAADARPAAEAYIKACSRYGPELRLNATYQVARALLAAGDKTTALGLDYARSAARQLRDGDSTARRLAVLRVLAEALSGNGNKDEAKEVQGQVAKLQVQLNNEELAAARRVVKALEDTDPLGQRVTAYRALVSALRKAGKADEGKEVGARLEKLEQQLDAEYEKKAIPFEVKKFAGRKGKRDRVAVVELFTGAQCPPCVAADIAFDAAVKTYSPKEAVFLQYHLHIPGPDPLTNADSEARAKYYGDKVEGTPAAFLDGEVTSPLGGFPPHAKDRYEALCKLVEEGLEEDAGARLTLKVNRKGDKIDLEATVDGLEEPGKKVKLRFVLIEDVVRYPGRNGRRLHHHVVRALPGGVDGVALEKKSGTHKASIDLGELRKKLDAYLTEYAKTVRPFLDEERPLALRKLEVVALIQKDDTKKILQAAQADVPEAE